MQTAHAHYLASSPTGHGLPVTLDGPHTLVLVFGPRSALDDPSLLRALTRDFPASIMMGSSSAGEMSGRGICDDTFSVALARFDRTRLHRSSTRLAGVGDSHAAGARLAAQLPVRGLRAVFMLSTGVNVNGAALVRGVAAALPAGVAISGGLAADGNRFERTWVLEAGEPVEDAVTAVGFYGAALRIGHGCSGGWTEFGPERRVTRAHDNVLHELDGRPALALYKHYLGETARRLPASALLFPLALHHDATPRTTMTSSALHGGAGEPGEPRRPENAPSTVVRTILAVDEVSQSMTFAGDMPVGARVRLMRTSVDRLVTSAEEAACQAMQAMEAEGRLDGAPVLAISVSCIGRRLVMGERTEEEVDAVVEKLPAGTVHAGFYSYGEIAPAAAAHGAELHNQTMTLTLLSEA